MAEIISIKVDPELQIIRCRASGDFTGPEAQEINDQTAREVEKLRDPGKVKILVDGRQMGKADAGARRIISRVLDRKNLQKFAIWGLPGHKQIFLSFMFRAMGLPKIRLFHKEREALHWLKQA